MYVNNPYAQGGWYNPANPQTINTERSGNVQSTQPSLFGALPYTFQAMGPSQRLIFQFTFSTGTILNCGVYGPASKKFLDVVTDINHKPHITTFRRYDGNVFGSIEWNQRPTVEIPGLLPRQYPAQWLKLCGNQCSRAMDVRGIKYIWTPVGDAIHLHPYNSQPAQQIIKIQRQSGSVCLDMSTEAVQAGMFELAIVATVLLQSGRNID